MARTSALSKPRAPDVESYSHKTASAVLFERPAAKLIYRIAPYASCGRLKKISVEACVTKLWPQISQLHR